MLTKITLEVTIVRVCDRTDTCLLGLNPKTMLSLFHVYINQYVKKVSVCFCVCMREREIERSILCFKLKEANQGSLPSLGVDTGDSTIVHSVRQSDERNSLISNIYSC